MSFSVSTTVDLNAPLEARPAMTTVDSSCAVSNDGESWGEDDGHDWSVMDTTSDTSSDSDASDSGSDEDVDGHAAPDWWGGEAGWKLSADADDAEEDAPKWWGGASGWNLYDPPSSSDSDSGTSDGSSDGSDSDSSDDASSTTSSAAADAREDNATLTSDWWDELFEERAGDTVEWCLSYATAGRFFAPHFSAKPDAKTLFLGTGNSTFAAEAASGGFPGR